MRSVIVHMLAVLLIAVLAIGVPKSVRADCLDCQDCTVNAPTKDHVPCPEGAPLCQLGQSCSGQVQKVPAHVSVDASPTLAKAIFGEAAAAAIKAAYIPPETAPPRL